MQPQTEGLEEQGPGRIPFVNDPAKSTGEQPEAEDEEELDDDEAV